MSDNACYRQWAGLADLESIVKCVSIRKMNVKIGYVGVNGRSPTLFLKPTERTFTFQGVLKPRFRAELRESRRRRLGRFEGSGVVQKSAKGINELG
jgi:hypothetical protein